MAEDLIRYDILAQDALRGVVRKVLAEVARTGLPGEHHFYITFDTHAPGVRISSRLIAGYPEEMTIILQHQFWDLTVSESSFEVGLSFQGVPERLLVPFNAVKAFVDPSVQFALQFESTSGESLGPVEATGQDLEPLPADVPRKESATPLPAPAAAPVAEEGGAAEPAAAENDAEVESGADVVSLDAFRKKS
jgi:hypothetical protein